MTLKNLTTTEIRDLLLDAAEDLLVLEEVIYDATDAKRKKNREEVIAFEDHVLGVSRALKCNGLKSSNAPHQAITAIENIATYERKRAAPLSRWANVRTRNNAMDALLRIGHLVCFCASKDKSHHNVLNYFCGYETEYIKTISYTTYQMTTEEKRHWRHDWNNAKGNN